MISFQDEATPTCGLAKSSSPMPTARSMPRAAVASRPSVTTRERGLMSIPSSPVRRAGGGVTGAVACRALDTVIGLGGRWASMYRRDLALPVGAHHLPPEPGDQGETHQRTEVGDHLLAEL